MSKCYKAEDVIRAIAKQMRFEAVLDNDDAPTDVEPYITGATAFLIDLPTIEVSEDCISKHDIWKIIEDNAYWVRYNENSTEKGMTLTGINQALNECPPVIPTVSEDCISREWLTKALDNLDWYDFSTSRENCEADTPQTNIDKAKADIAEWSSWSKTYEAMCGAKMKGADDETRNETV